jgi:hypothetical protein
MHCKNALHRFVLPTKIYYILIVASCTEFIMLLHNNGNIFMLQVLVYRTVKNRTT